MESERAAHTRGNQYSYLGGDLRAKLCDGRGGGEASNNAGAPSGSGRICAGFRPARPVIERLRRERRARCPGTRRRGAGCTRRARPISDAPPTRRSITELPGNRLPNAKQDAVYSDYPPVRRKTLRGTTLCSVTSSILSIIPTDDCHKI